MKDLTEIIIILIYETQTFFVLSVSQYQTQ